MNIDDMIKAEGTVVVTSQLREGDIIRNHGCLMQIGEVKSRKDRPDEPVFHTVYWSAAKIVHRFDGTVPMGWFDKQPDGSLTWQVQGNDRAKWVLVHRPEQEDAA